MLTINDKHEYFLDGLLVPSVTQIIHEILGVQWNASEWYLTRGQAIHKCAEFIAQGKSFEFDKRLSGYVTALKKFFADVKPELKYGFGEQMVVSKTFRYAGTIDLPCKISGINVIVDYKHSIDLERLKLQCGGYSKALSEYTNTPDINHGCGVQIIEDGTYRMTEIFNLKKSRGEFLALRTVYEIRERMNQIGNNHSGSN
jgi:hypothetical protein